MDAATKARVSLRAGGFCEYCHISGEFFFLPFQIEHIIAKKHHGSSEDSNLALACDRCNQHKGANLAGVDKETGEMTRLFHPRSDDWAEHFVEFASGEIFGISAIGRVTVDVLEMNVASRVELRYAIASLRQEPNQ